MNKKELILAERRKQKVKFFKHRKHILFMIADIYISRTKAKEEVVISKWCVNEKMGEVERKRERGGGYTVYKIK